MDKSCAEDVPSAVSTITEEGYCIFKNVFDEKEINEMRRLIRDHLNSNGKFRFGGRLELRAMQRAPNVADILISDRLLNVMTECTSPNKPIMTGECDLHMNVLSKWHKDIDFDGEGEWKELSYRADGGGVFKAAIYLQPQSSKSPDALKVRPRSHKHRLGEVARAEALGVKAGDVIVFDMRVDHAGRFPSPVDRLMQKSLKAGQRWLKKDHERWFTLLRTKLGRISKKSERMAVYLTFGGPNPATFAYQKFARSYHGPAPSKLSEQVQAKLSKWSIKVIEA